MWEKLWGRERLSGVESWTQIELSALKVDVARRHLFSVINAQSYEEVMDKDSQKTVTAIQTLLVSAWYDVGKIDWFLVTKWQETSKTTNAIKKFQKDRWITPIDGLPWPITIRELYNYSLSHESDIYKLILKSSLTAGETWEIVMYWNKNQDTALNLWHLKSITNEHAKELWKLKCRRLALPGLTTLTDKQVESLRNFIYLDLSWLTNLTNKQAKDLSNVTFLNLRWLKSITDIQVSELAKVKRLHIDERILTPSQKKVLKNRVNW